MNAAAERFRDRMQMFDELLHDPSRAEFVCVCIPTRLSSAETGRLVPELLEQEVGVRHLVVNQMLSSEGDVAAFLSRRRTEQHGTL